MRQELQEVVNDPLAIVVVEWGDIVEEVLPGDHITIAISATGETARTITVQYQENFAYIRL